MPFEFISDDLSKRGLINYQDGLAAEDAVARYYSQQGYEVIAQRWRGLGGEIDLVLRHSEGFVFVEVKKSTDFASAAAHLSFDQLHRIALAGEEFIGTKASDPLTPMRLDLAIVDKSGQIETLENLTLY